MTDATPRLAVIGCGHWGRNLIRNFHELGALAAVCDVDERLSQRAAERTKVQGLSWLEVLKERRIDGVVIATPPATHAELALDALHAGKHVFVEKPMALSLANGEELIALADRHGRVLMVGHLLQYHPAFLQLRELVAAGALGRLRYVYSNRLNLGRFRREENILWSFAPHDISMMIALIGEEPEEVTAIGHPFLHKSIADITTTHLSFPAGEKGHIFVSWLHPYKDHKLVVVGETGMAVFDDASAWPEKLRLYRHQVAWKNGRPEPARAEPELIAIEEKEPLAAECEHFLECIQRGERPRTDGRDGLRVLRVLHAAEESKNAQGQPVRLRAGTENIPTAFVHDTATIDEGVALGAGTKVWHYSHILPNVAIGNNCIIGQNVMIGPDVKVGKNCKVQNNVSIYKGITLEDGVFCGPSCVFTNVNMPRAEIERKDKFQPTLVRRGATIGANATIICGVTLGEYSFVAAGATVTKDVSAYALVAGIPARQIGWVGRAGEKLDKNLLCPRTGESYELDATGRLQPRQQDSAVAQEYA